MHHTVFALPFAYMGAFLAANGLPCWHNFLFITLAMVGARSCAMILDNLIDLKYDRLQPRLKKRPLVAGELKKGEVIILFFFCLALFIYAALQLEPICIYLAPLAVFILAIYPYTKRFTYLCHFVLGTALSMAPIGGWIAIKGTLNFPILCLGLGVCLWIGGFDALYGSQDEAFDKSHGLHSLATKFSARRVFRIVPVVHIVSLLCFCAVGYFFALAPIYYAGIALAAITLVYQHSIVSWQDYSRLTQVYFMRNGLVSIAIFAFTAISILYR